MLRGVKRTAFEPIRDCALEKDLAWYPVDIPPHCHGLALRKKCEDSIDVVITPALPSRPLLDA